MVQTILSAKQKQRHNIENKHVDARRGRGRWDEFEIGIDADNTMYKIDN